MNRKFQFFALLLGTLLALLNVPAYADRAPSWMVGTFENDARRGERAITLRASSDGVLSATAIGGDFTNLTRISANYRGNNLILDGQEYTVTRTGDGFRAVPDLRRRPAETNRVVTLLFHRAGSANS